MKFQKIILLLTILLYLPTINASMLDEQPLSSRTLVDVTVLEYQTDYVRIHAVDDNEVVIGSAKDLNDSNIILYGEKSRQRIRMQLLQEDQNLFTIMTFKKPLSENELQEFENYDANFKTVQYISSVGSGEMIYPIDDSLTQDFQQHIEQILERDNNILDFNLVKGFISVKAIMPSSQVKNALKHPNLLLLDVGPIEFDDENTWILPVSTSIFYDYNKFISTLSPTDLNSPVVNIGAPLSLSYSYTEESVSVDFNVLDDRDLIPDINVFLDGNLYNGIDINMFDLNVGMHNLSVYAGDDSNNQGFDEINFTVIDNVKPNVFVSEIIDQNYSYTDYMTISFSANDKKSGISSLQADINGIEFQSGDYFAITFN